MPVGGPVLQKTRTAPQGGGPERGGTAAQPNVEQRQVQTEEKKQQVLAAKKAEMKQKAENLALALLARRAAKTAISGSDLAAVSNPDAVLAVIAGEKGKRILEYQLSSEAPGAQVTVPEIPQLPAVQNLAELKNDPAHAALYNEYAALAQFHDIFNNPEVTDIDASAEAFAYYQMSHGRTFVGGQWVEDQGLQEAAARLQTLAETPPPQKPPAEGLPEKVAAPLEPPVNSLTEAEANEAITTNLKKLDQTVQDVYEFAAKGLKYKDTLIALHYCFDYDAADAAVQIYSQAEQCYSNPASREATLTTLKAQRVEQQRLDQALTHGWDSDQVSLLTDEEMTKSAGEQEALKKERRESLRKQVKYITDMDRRYENNTPNHTRGHLRGLHGEKLTHLSKAIAAIEQNDVTALESVRYAKSKAIQDRDKAEGYKEYMKRELKISDELFNKLDMLKDDPEVLDALKKAGVKSGLLLGGGGGIGALILALWKFLATGSGQLQQGVGIPGGQGGY